MSAPDVLIVGAGPAGSAAAILIARAGGRVVLLDKVRFPRDKLCGEFLSPESIGILARAGVLPALAADAGRARRAVLTSDSGRRLEISLPLAHGSSSEALGIPRLDMDLALVEEAARLGADVVEGFEVRSVRLSGDRVAGLAGAARSSGREQVFSAPWVLAADGRDSALGRLLGGPAVHRPTSARFAIKAHFRAVRGLTDAIELHAFRGGYVGLHPVGGGRVNVCALMDRAVAPDLPKDPDAIVRDAFCTNPFARFRLETAQRMSEWYAVASLVFRREHPVRAGALFLGDAAGTIDPFAGEGMAMALRSAELAVDAVRSALGSEGPRAQDAPSAALAYARRWSREFDLRIALCRNLGRLMVRPALHSPLLGVLSHWPALANRLARGTRAGAPARDRRGATELREH